MGKGYLGNGVWCLTPTHAVAQSAVADIQNKIIISIIIRVIY